MDPQTKKRIADWRNFEPAVDLLSESELENAFYTTLKFGTGGLRGLMGVGSNRMNRHTVAFATQGLANYIGKGSVFIGYDTRNHSKEFANVAAQVLSGNGIKVFLNHEVCPTPITSFSCRYYKCQAAIMITASHNPPAYNGYKVFWDDGGQILPPHDHAIIDEVAKITTPQDVKFSTDLIEEVGEENLKAYLEAMDRLKLTPIETSDLKIVYTNLHGTGLKPTTSLLKRWGFEKITWVDGQTDFDGNFPTVNYPNPEDPAALKLGVRTLLESQSDLLIAQDPDADRMRAVITHQGKPVYLNGNQLAALLLFHIATHAKLPKGGVCIKTIVTTELLSKIAEDHGLACINVLTGFKYIAQKIREWELTPGSPTFIFGGEESYGSLYGTCCRDKDGVMSACLIAEMAHLAKLEQKTLWDKYEEIQAKYGKISEYIHSIDFPESKLGKEEMVRWMDRVRKSPRPKNLTKFLDYLNDPKLPKSDMLQFGFSDGTKLVIRPSGTEPKIKIYAEGTDEKICKEHLESFFKMMGND